MEFIFWFDFNKYKIARFISFNKLTGCICARARKWDLIHIFRDRSTRYWKLFRWTISRSVYLQSWLHLFVSRLKKCLMDILFVSFSIYRGEVSLCRENEKRSASSRKTSGTTYIPGLSFPVNRIPALDRSSPSFVENRIK